ncbi:hypothetical protein BLNAU_19898 [Blattamonas nauphoetae]|uniref:Uncharacterized protein n=1 Tax=Blattamonas nauphoetae TaxID=2049346 RepID=A0ABQ9X1D4_9EUKA|nr:hypothetical protein BLNAU_19898 [Blattamonas nauphoetae]
MLSSPPATIDTLPPFPCEEQDSKVQDLIVRESDEENSAWTAPQVLRFGRDADEQLVITGDFTFFHSSPDERFPYHLSNDYRQFPHRLPFFSVAPLRLHPFQPSLLLFVENKTDDERVVLECLLKPMLVGVDSAVTPYHLILSGSRS